MTAVTRSRKVCYSSGRATGPSDCSKVRALPGHQNIFRVFRYAKAADRANRMALQADRVADAARGKPEEEIEVLLDVAINAHLEAANKVAAFFVSTAFVKNEPSSGYDRLFT